MKNWLSVVLLIVCVVIVAILLTDSPPIAKPTPRANTPVLHGEVNIGLLVNITPLTSSLPKQAMNSAELAIDEINASGGILGRKVRLVTRNVKLKKDLAKAEALSLIAKEKVVMLTNDFNSSITLAISEVAKERRVLFLSGAAQSPRITASEGHRYIFRTGYNSTMQTRTIASYLNRQYSGKTYFYVTWDYVWGWDTEAAFREYTHTQDTSRHKGVLIPYPDYKEEDILRAVRAAKERKADVLVVNLYGKPFVALAKAVSSVGLQESTRIVISTEITYETVKNHGRELFARMIGSSFFATRAPFEYDYPRGQKFIRDFVKRFGYPPGHTAAAAYTSINQYRLAVERVGTFDTDSVVEALEGHTFQFLKGKEHYRKFDHQNVQDVFVTKFKSTEELKQQEFEGDFWNVLRSEPGEDIVLNREEWNKIRIKHNMPTYLEPQNNKGN